MKRADFINKRLREANKARVYIINVNDVMLEYHKIFGKQTKPLASEPQLLDFYHLRRLRKMVSYYLL